MLGKLMVKKEFNVNRYNQEDDQKIFDIGWKKSKDGNENKTNSTEELVVRYKRCNLSTKTCPLCFARDYTNTKYNSELLDLNVDYDKARHKVDINKINRIRILGGEPCLNIDRMKQTIQIAECTVKRIHNDKSNKRDLIRAIIQTNGIGFSSLSNEEVKLFRNFLESTLKSIKDSGRIVFEVSFKLPYYKTIKESDLQIQIKNQYEGYKVLLNDIINKLWDKDYDNIAIYPVAGFGPDLTVDEENLSLVPIDWLESETKNIKVPIFSQDTWGDEFRQVQEEFVNKIVKGSAYKDYRDKFIAKKTKTAKIPLEQIEVPKRKHSFQKHWIKAYLRDCNGCSGHDIGDVIVNIGKNKFIGKEWEGIINQVAKELGYEINNILIFKFKQNIQLNSVEEKARIRKNIQDMKDVFYGVVPKDHYRYL